MKATSNLLASLLFLTACGNVLDPTDDPATDGTGDTGLGKVDGIDLGDGDGSGSNPPPPPELPFIVETPRAATSSSSLFAVNLAQGVEVRNVVGQFSATARYDVLEQVLITKSDEAIDVNLSLVAPTGTFARSIATDAVKNSPNPVAQTTLCSLDDIDYGRPECVLSPPAHRTTPVTGPITRGRWRVQLVNDATGQAVSCIPASTYSIHCVVPAGSSGTAYRFVVSADGFEDLWDGSPGVGEFTLDGKRFTGVNGGLDFQCSSFDVDPGKEWCYAHWVFNRFTAIDAAALSFDPMTVTVSAAGATEQFSSAALTWDAGNDDLPGDAY